MAGILDSLLGGLVESSSVQTLSQTAKADSSQVESLLSAAIPLLMNTMANNASTEEGAASLSNALDSHAADASSSGISFSDIASLLGGADTDDGAKILNHIFGGKTETKAETTKLAKSTGLSTKQVLTILAAVAPILLKLLGTTKQETNTDSSGLGSMLSLLTGTSSSSGKKDDNSTGELLGSVLSALLK